MRIGLATPARQSVGSRCPRVVTVSAAAILFVGASAGCSSTSPVTAPSSTIPAPDSSAVASTPAVPDYETDLDLNEEEKEAVDGALVAFVGYVDTINKVFSSGGVDLEGAEKYARAGSLESLKTEAESMQANNQYMAGKYSASKIRIESISTRESGSPYSEVSILFCTRDSEWSVVDRGQELPSMAPRGITMQHVADDRDGTWKIGNQYLRSKECE